MAACASPAGSPWPASGPSPIADSRRSAPSASSVSTAPRSAPRPSTSVDRAGCAEVGGLVAGERALAERDDERLARDPLGALLLDELVVGDVADEAGVRRVRAAHPRDRDLDGEGAAVGVAGLELDALVEDAGGAAVEQAPQAVAVRLAPGRRDDELGHVLADRLLARVAEHPLGGGVELEHDAVGRRSR